MRARLGLRVGCLLLGGLGLLGLLVLGARLGRLLGRLGALLGLGLVVLGLLALLKLDMGLLGG